MKIAVKGGAGGLRGLSNCHTIRRIGMTSAFREYNKSNSIKSV